MTGKELIINTVRQNPYIFLECAHRWEPFPLYVPKGIKQKLHWWFICARWQIVKHFVKYKSPLNGWHV